MNLFLIGELPVMVINPVQDFATKNKKPNFQKQVVSKHIQL